MATTDRVIGQRNPSWWPRYLARRCAWGNGSFIAMFSRLMLARPCCTVAFWYTNPPSELTWSSRISVNNGLYYIRTIYTSQDLPTLVFVCLRARGRGNKHTRWRRWTCSYLWWFLCFVLFDEFQFECNILYHLFLWFLLYNICNI